MNLVKANLSRAKSGSSSKLENDLSRYRDFVPDERPVACHRGNVDERRTSTTTSSAARSSMTEKKSRTSSRICARLQTLTTISALRGSSMCRSAASVRLQSIKSRHYADITICLLFEALGQVDFIGLSARAANALDEFRRYDRKLDKYAGIFICHRANGRNP